jgi:hypothetical protein
MSIKNSINSAKNRWEEDGQWKESDFLVRVLGFGDKHHVTNAPHDSKSVLRLLRETRIAKIFSSPGPRLAEATVVNLAAIYAEAKEKVKAFNQRVRSEAKTKSNKIKKEEIGIKKSVSVSELKKSVSVSELKFSNIAEESQERKTKVTKSLDKLLKLSQDALMSGELEIPEELLYLMKDSSLRTLNKQELSMNDPIFRYRIPKVRRDHEGVNPDLIKLPVTISSPKLNASYERLRSDIKLPPSSLSKPKSGTIVYHQPAGSVSTFRGYSSQEIALAAPDLTPAVLESDFWMDFEILLERQTALEQEMLTLISATDKSDHKRQELLVRFPRNDIIALVFNMFAHIRKEKKVLIDWDVSATIFSIARKWLTFIVDDERDSRVAHELKELFKTGERKTLLELKAYIGHIKRIVLSSTESKSGMRELTKAISAFLGPLLFAPIIIESESYSPSVLQVGNSAILNDEDIVDFERTYAASSRPESPSRRICSTPKSQLPSRPVSAFRPPVEMLGQLSLFISRNELPTSDVANSGIKPQVFISRAATSLCFESDLEKIERYQSMIEKDLSLFDVELPIPWQGRIVDILVRFWEFIFTSK